MRRATTFVAGLIAVASIALVGCDVDKTKEGNVTLPKYDVKKTQEGSVTAPEFKVTTPDVSVGTKQETITVPTIDVKTADEKKAEQGKK